jgi:hypothetical protein
MNVLKVGGQYVNCGTIIWKSLNNHGNVFMKYWIHNLTNICWVPTRPLGAVLGICNITTNKWRGKCFDLVIEKQCTDDCLHLMITKKFLYWSKIHSHVFPYQFW